MKKWKELQMVNKKKMVRSLLKISRSRC